MNSFESELKLLIGLWKKRAALIEYSDEDNWIPPLLAIEHTIEEKTNEIATQAYDNRELLLNYYRTVKSSENFVILHIMLSATDSGLFENNLTLVKELKTLLNDESSDVYVDIVMAANFCPQSQVEPIIDLMLRAESAIIVSSAYKIISNLTLHSYEKKCVASLKSIVHSGELSEQTLPRSLIEAIQKIHAVSALDLLERIATDKQITSNSNLSLLVSTTLISLGSKIGWDQYLEFCKNTKWSYEDVLTIGQYGNKDDIQFIIEQIESQPPLSWLCGYLYALGLSGSLSIIDILIQYCTHSELDVRQHALDAFYELTGTRDTLALDVEEDYAEVQEELNDWCNDNLEKLDNLKRYSRGSPFSLTQFIDDLSDESPVQSLESLESLIVYTSKAFPFNAYGYLRNRLDQKNAWRDWHVKNMSSFPDGARYRWGKSID